MIIRFILFGMLGLIGALLYSAIRNSFSKRSLDLSAQTSLILFPAFGLIAILYPIVAIHLGNLPWYLRGVVYMLAFYILQYIIGYALTKFGACPWKYPKGGSLQGLVRLSDAPAWFLAGLLAEWIYPYVKVTANALA